MAEYRKLFELRVIDLRTELAKRNLDKSGIKNELLDRLHDAIVLEGHDPDEYMFEVDMTEKKVKSTNKRRTGGELEEAQNSFVEDEETSTAVEAADGEVAEVEGKDGEVIAGGEEAKAKVKDEDMEDGNTKGGGVKDDAANVGDEIDENGDVENATMEYGRKEFDKMGTKCEGGGGVEESGGKVVETPSREDKKCEKTDGAMVGGKLTGEEERQMAECKEEDKEDKEGKRLDKNKEDNEDNTNIINLTIGEEDVFAEAEEEEMVGESMPAKGEPEGNVPEQKAPEEKANGTKSSDKPEEVKATSKSDDKKSSSKVTTSRNLWVSGLSSMTKATDLKQLFSKHRKVVSAKIVTNAKTPGARCYGYVTMLTADDATLCMQNLNKTELHGRKITVERAKDDGSGPVNDAKKDDKKRSVTDSSSKANDDKRQKSDHRSGDSKKDKPKSEKRSRPAGEAAVENGKDGKAVKSDADARDREKEEVRRREREHRMKEEREKQRLREKERILRQESHRRKIERERQREVERRQREEAARLEKERLKLKLERERIERERLELLKLERETQRLERERLAREKEELKRAQQKLEESRRATKRTLDMRSYEDDRVASRRPPSPPPRDSRHVSASGRKEPPPPPPPASSRTSRTDDYARRSFPSSSSAIDPRKESTSSSSHMRGVKESSSRYDHGYDKGESARHGRFHPPEPPSKMPAKESSRYADRTTSGGEWNTRTISNAPSKYVDSKYGSSRDGWVSGDRSKTDQPPWVRSSSGSGASDRWQGGSGGSSSMNLRTPYGGNYGVPSMSSAGNGMGPASSNAPSYADRFDVYKGGISGRKY